jgi:uncharacterized protein (TIGR03083 family)
LRQWRNGTRREELALTEAGLHGMRAAGDDLLEVAAALTPAQWDTESAATGWSVKDVVIHVGTALEFVQAVVGGAESPPLGTEELNDIVVAEHRDWTAAAALELLRKQIPAAIATFTALQAEPVASTQTQILDLGTYPLHAISDMFTFDLVTHLRYDILGPRGPIPLQVSDFDEVRLTPTVTWLASGLAQMQPDLGAHVAAPIALQLTGPGGRRLLLQSDGGALTVEESDDAAVATVISTTRDFIAWSTKRVPWRAVTRVEGDEDAAVDFLDFVNLI